MSERTQGDQVYPAVASDAAGDYLVAWQDASDGSGTGVYAHRFNASGVEQNHGFYVPTYWTGAQTAPAVAMDAGGDAVITWTSYDQQFPGSVGIYAQRFNPNGLAVGTAFQVNTYVTGAKNAGRVAMDAAGNFVVVWSSYTQDGSGVGIYGRRYNSAGVAQGGEFRVNTYTTQFQYNSSIAMNSAGDFVVTWQSENQDLSSDGIYAQRFNAAGVAQGSEFAVNTYTTHSQHDPAVAIDNTGDFVIAWASSNQAVSTSSDDVYARRFSPAGVGQGAEFLVNVTTVGHQWYPAIGMEGNGNFVVAWESQQDADNSYGIYSRSFTAAGTADSGEFRVNTYTTAAQKGVQIAMNSAGQFVDVWRSNTQDGSGYEIYSQRYQITVGPIITAVRMNGRFVQYGDQVNEPVKGFVIDFSEDMDVTGGSTGPSSVLNPFAWQLTKNGSDISGQIGAISFSFNVALNRYQATMSFPTQLAPGVYQLTATPGMKSKLGKALDGDANGVAGGNFVLSFVVATTIPSGPETQVNTYTTGAQIMPAVASDSSGNYVVVWASAQDGNSYGIYGQRYNAKGVAQGSEFRVNATTTNRQYQPAVAMDSVGDFVVTWTSKGQDGDKYGVYGRRYNAVGVAQGGEFQVNTYTTGNQFDSTVAMDAAGDFIVAWSSSQGVSSYEIYGQLFLSTGVEQDAEFQVNTYTTSVQALPSAAMDAEGDFVIVWESSQQDSSGYGVYGQRFDKLGAFVGPEFRANSSTTLDQRDPAVGMDPAGNFVVAWDTNNGFDGNQEGVFAQKYDANGLKTSFEFQVNSYTTNDQYKPRIAMDGSGEFVITWGSLLQDGSQSGVFAQRFDATATAIGNEFQVNTYFTFTQATPAVAMDLKGDFVVAWTSALQDGSNYGIYTQSYKADFSPLLSGIELTAVNAPPTLNTNLTSTLTATDLDDTTWSGAVIQFTSNFVYGQDFLGFVNQSGITGFWNGNTGKLTLTGVSTVSNYQAALRSVTYHNTSATPNTNLVRTIGFQVTDGMLSSNVVTRDLNVAAVSTPPVLSNLSGTATYAENAIPVLFASNLSVSDVDSPNLVSAIVSFTNWQAEDRVNFNNIFALQHSFTQDLTAHTAKLTITGIETVDHYQTLLRSVNYWDVSDSPNVSARVASFTVNDGLDNSNSITRNIVVKSINDAPTLSAIETTPLIVQANNPAFPPQPISATLLVTDPDSTKLTKAVVQITAGYQNQQNAHDVLSFTNQAGITGSFDAMTGTLTLTGLSSVSNYRTALRSVKFSSSGVSISSAMRTFTITATDDASPTPATSLVATRNISILTTNVPPAVSGIAVTPINYMRGTAAVAVVPGIVVLDPDGINLASAIIQITGNYQNGQDVLSFTAGFGVTGSFSAASGALTLTGVTSLANYQTLLRSVTFKTKTATASTAVRTVTFEVHDGIAPSADVSKLIHVT